MKTLLLFACFLFVLTDDGYSQLTYNGVTTLTQQQSIKTINGIWNSADHTGNVTMDKILDKLAVTYKTQSKAIIALEGSAAQIKTNPPKYINPDGSVNKEALADLLNQKFAAIGKVTIPAPDSLGTQPGAMY